MARFTTSPRRGPRGSTVIILVMFVAVVGYVALDAWMFAHYMAYMPMDLTTLVGACFVAETVSLARLRMAKERKGPMPAKTDNPFLQTLGAAVPDFEPEVQEELNDQTEGDSVAN